MYEKEKMLEVAKRVSQLQASLEKECINPVFPEYKQEIFERIYKYIADYQKEHAAVIFFNGKEEDLQNALASITFELQQVISDFLSKYDRDIANSLKDLIESTMPDPIRKELINQMTIDEVIKRIKSDPTYLKDLFDKMWELQGIQHQKLERTYAFIGVRVLLEEYERLLGEFKDKIPGFVDRRIIMLYLKYYLNAENIITHNT